MSVDVLIFAEDPGAANYVAPLLAALGERGYTIAVLTAGLATARLRARGVTVQPTEESTSAEKALEMLDPRVVVVGTSENRDTLGLALVAAARQRDVPTVGVIDAAMNAAYRFRGATDRALTYAPDWLLVADEWTRQAFVALGFPAAHAIVAGHPHYDHVLEVRACLEREGRDAVRARALPGVDGGRRAVVVVAEGRARTERLLERLVDAVRGIMPQPYLVLRPHPKDRVDDYAYYRDAFDLVTADGPPLELVYAADVVVGATSMLVLEAALLGRPTLAIVERDEEREWLPSIRAGVTECASTCAEGAAALARLLEGSDGGLTAVSAREWVVRGASRRAVGLLEEILAERAALGSTNE